jgi:hypothetical protein
VSESISAPIAATLRDRPWLNACTPIWHPGGTTTSVFELPEKALLPILCLSEVHNPYVTVEQYFSRSLLFSWCSRPEFSPLSGTWTNRNNRR